MNAIITHLNYLALERYFNKNSLDESLLKNPEEYHFLVNDPSFFTNGMNMRYSVFSEYARSQLFFRYIGLFRKEYYYDGWYENNKLLCPSRSRANRINLQLCNLFSFPVNGNKWLSITLSFKGIPFFKGLNTYSVEFLLLDYLLFSFNYITSVQRGFLEKDQWIDYVDYEYLLCFDSNVDLELIISYLKNQFLLIPTFHTVESISGSLSVELVNISFSILKTSEEIAHYFKATSLFNRYLDTDLYGHNFNFIS